MLISEESNITPIRKPILEKIEEVFSDLETFFMKYLNDVPPLSVMVKTAIKQDLFEGKKIEIQKSNN